MLNRGVSKKRRTLLWVVSGPSGSGKTTICKRLARKKSLNIARSISYTTRAQKKGEKNQRDYIFISKGEFLKKVKRSEFLEWQEVFGSLYGTPKKHLLGLLRQNKDVLLCIDVKGALDIRKKFPQRVVFIFIVPPTRKELTLRHKLRGREDKEEMRKRLAFAKTELSFVKNYDYIIVNDDLPKAVRDIESIIVAKRLENVLYTR